MIPSVMQEIYQPFRDAISAIKEHETVLDDWDFHMGLSRAYERYGHALLQNGYFREALEQFVEATDAAIPGDDRYWYSPADYRAGYCIDQPFRGQFFRLYNLCRRLVSEHPGYKNFFQDKKREYHWGILTDWQEDYLDEFWCEVKVANEWRRAMNFGRRA